MNYQPSKLARGLKGRHSYLIGAVLADITNPYSTAILRGAEDACHKRGYNLLVCNTDNDPGKERDYILMLQSHQIDGLIINTTGQNNALLRAMKADHLPIVLVDREVPDFDADVVTVNNRQAAKEATEFLIRQGYKRIAYVTQPVQGVSTRTERVTAFSEALQASGLATGQDVLEVDDDAKVHLAIRDFIAGSAPGPKALFAGNAVVLLQVILELRRHDIDVPGEIGVLGFDNPEWAEIARLTTLAQPTYRIGVQAAERLLMRLEGSDHPYEHIHLPVEMVERASTPAV
ncbi:substrate-binding domain-containing protein [Alicyclobacillus fastidiosus]|uniref:Substrate-binding domain-containing protein n=1 Tax=Alicyclobacillus fastidiosus TaxID=392011 RepID=A0ABY6ZG80_9BACL|nr:substrate-binding domain-containing protein [Alicyclobacillus fastidiosus]WAH41129.1 substrate-binding domain-containing protein [Alicyclobacillus fastidiosus]GMA62690.1 LacI family transcriptional regulator [Alicyclobacillus fastidiosus]